METDNGTNYIQEGIAEHEREREAEITRLNKVIDAMAGCIASELACVLCAYHCTPDCKDDHEACIAGIIKHFKELP